MGDTGRNILWRQGQILCSESVKALKLDNPAHETIAVMVSHDCDLAQREEVEPVCEIILGKIIDALDGTYAWARSARRLHLRFTGGRTEIIAELDATNRKTITKSALRDHSPATNICLTPHELSTLQHWLAARYRRAAFPDQFENRMKKKGVADKLKKILKSTGDHVVAILFDLDRGEMIEREPSENVYALTVLIIYSADNDPDESEGVASAAAKRIKELFRKTFLSDGIWHDIELQDILAISEETLTMRQARLLKQWNVDYLSIADGDPILGG